MIKQFQRGFFFFFLLLASHLVEAKPQSLDSIVATVNETIITQSEVDKAMDAVKYQMMSTHAALPPLDTLRKQVLEQLVDRKLQLQAAEQAGIKINDAELDSAIENIARNNGMSLNELYEKLATQGLTKSAYRKEISEEMTLQRIEQQEVGSKISLNADDIKNAKRTLTPTHFAAPEKEYEVEDLLVLLPENASPAEIASAKEKADALVKKIETSTSYKEVADSETGNKSIEENSLGWRKLTELPSAFMAPIQTMKENTVAQPIQTANGFHVLYLSDVRIAANDIPPTPALTDQQAEQVAYQHKFEVAVKKWISRLRSQALINMSPNA